MIHYKRLFFWLNTYQICFFLIFIILYRIYLCYTLNHSGNHSSDVILKLRTCNWKRLYVFHYERKLCKFLAFLRRTNERTKTVLKFMIYFDKNIFDLESNQVRKGSFQNFIKLLHHFIEWNILPITITFLPTSILLLYLTHDFTLWLNIYFSNWQEGY